MKRPEEKDQSTYSLLHSGPESSRLSTAFLLRFELLMFCAVTETHTANPHPTRVAPRVQLQRLMCDAAPPRPQASPATAYHSPAPAPPTVLPKGVVDPPPAQSPPQDGLTTPWGWPADRRARHRRRRGRRARRARHSSRLRCRRPSASPLRAARRARCAAAACL